MRGGLAQINVLVSIIFSGMSGSAIADAAGPGLVTIRQMEKRPGYTPGFAGAVVATASTIGPIIPPSIPMVIYALVSGASVGALFIGGVIPGLLMALSLMITIQVIAVRQKMPREAPVPRSQYLGLLWRGSLPLTIPVVLLTGIYSGAFTPTEAAGVAAIQALILASVVYRALPFKRLVQVFIESARSSATVTMIIAGAFILNYAFTAEGVPASLANWVAGIHLSQVQFLLLVNVVFLVLGCFLDTAVMLLVFVPMLIPTAQMLHVDLVHFGVVVVVNMMIGLVTPPFGMLLFVINALAGIPIKDMLKEGWVFLVALLCVLLLITLVPDVVLWLPRSMGYKAG